MCRALQVLRSGYYAWRQRPASARTIANRQLVVKIRALHQQHQQHRQRYGSPRIHAELRHQGERVGRHRVARLMRAEGLRSRHRRRFPITTKADARLPVAANVLDRQFTADRPNQVWVGDISYVWTAQGWLYVAVLLDLYSRRVIGLGLSERIDTTLALKALTQALGQRQARVGLIHRSNASPERPRKSICFSCLPATAGSPRIDTEHESQSELLGQRCRRELFRHLKN